MPASITHSMKLSRFKTALCQVRAVSSASTVAPSTCLSKKVGEILAALPSCVKGKNAQVYVKSVVEIIQKEAELAIKDAEILQKNAELAVKDAELAIKVTEMNAELAVKDAERKEAITMNNLQHLRVKLLVSTDTLNARGLFEHLEESLLMAMSGYRKDKWKNYFKSNPEELDDLRKCDAEITDAAVAGEKFSELYGVLSERIHRHFQVSRTSDSLEVPRTLLSPAEMCLYEFVLKKANVSYYLV